MFFMKRLSIPIIFMIFTGERGLEICCNGIRSFIFMVIYNCRRRRYGWYHTSGTDFIRYTSPDWHKNVWNRISHCEATCHPADLIIYFTHAHTHSNNKNKLEEPYISESSSLQIVLNLHDGQWSLYWQKQRAAYTNRIQCFVCTFECRGENSMKIEMDQKNS